MAVEIKAKMLAGLKFKTSDKREVEEDGVKRKRYFAVERALKPADVTSAVDLGDSIGITTADGKKYSLAKDGTDAGGDQGK